MTIKETASIAKAASVETARLSAEDKNRALAAISRALEAGKADIFAANAADIMASQAESQPVLKRLRFDEGKLADVKAGIEGLIALPDPCGRVLKQTLLDDGLLLKKVSCPIGVIGMVFESRPDALVQISTLCLKSGNCVLLKGGKEAINTNRALFNIIYTAAVDAGFPCGCMGLMETRDDVQEMLKLNESIDLIVPRGSNAFVKYIMENTSIPVLGHADGICHVYIDKYADINKAVEITVDSKTQYVSVCNAAETLLVHKDIAARVLPLIKQALEAKGTTLYGCERTREYIDVAPASQKDWQTEYLDYKLSIKIVDSLEDAVKHINTYGSGHTDAIVTENTQAAEYFMDSVDSANVFFNCSTRFSDGFRYGFGAEVGISTNKIHARGPVGLEGLMIYKYKLYGSGDTVAPYAAHKKTFKHIDVK